MNDLQRRALEYIRNAGGSPEVAWFDDDHDPIGPQLRSDLRRMGVAEELDDRFTEKRRIVLTDVGRSELGGQK